MSKLREKINANKNPGPRIAVIGFLVAILGLLLALMLSEGIGRLIFYFGFTATVVGILTTVIIVIKEKTRS